MAAANEMSEADQIKTVNTSLTLTMILFKKIMKLISDFLFYFSLKTFSCSTISYLSFVLRTVYMILHQGPLGQQR